MRACGLQSNTRKYWRFPASKSEYQYFYHIIFSKGVFEFATGNVDWRLSRVLRGKINNASYATVDLVRKIVVGTRMKMLSFTKGYMEHNLMYAPPIPSPSPLGTRPLCVIIHVRVFPYSLIPFTTLSRSPFIVIAWFIVLRLHKAYWIVAVDYYEFSTIGIRLYMDYRIKICGEVSYYISRGT